MSKLDLPPEQAFVGKKPRYAYIENEDKSLTRYYITGMTRTRNMNEMYSSMDMQARFYNPGPMKVSLDLIEDRLMGPDFALQERMRESIKGKAQEINSVEDTFPRYPEDLITTPSVKPEPEPEPKDDIAKRFKNIEADKR